MTVSKPRVVFISYSHEDSSFVERLVVLLLSYDLDVWKDSKDLPIGGNIPKQVYDGIKRASHFCCIISHSSVRSAWVEEELSFAKMRQLDSGSLQIVPILIDNVIIPDFLAAYRCAHLEDRDLSPGNAEIVMILRAFGIEAQVAGTHVISGAKRKALLEACRALKETIAEMAEPLVGFVDSRVRQREEDAQRGFAAGIIVWPQDTFPSRATAAFGDWRDHYEHDRSRRERQLSEADNRRGWWAELRRLASEALANLDRLRANAVEAGINEFRLLDVFDHNREELLKRDFQIGAHGFVLWPSLLDAARRVDHICKKVMRDETGSRTEDWWPASINIAQLTLTEVVVTLESWEMFDQHRIPPALRP